MVKQALASVDEEKLFPFNLPALAATDESIQAAESVLKIKLDGKYIEFLRFANGWPGLIHSVDLFGTDDLIGSEKMIAARAMVSYLDDSVITSVGYHRDGLLPIAAAQSDKDIFAMALPSTGKAGEVLWFAGELVEKFVDFNEFYLAMVDYNRADLEFMSRAS